MSTHDDLVDSPDRADSSSPAALAEHIHRKVPDHARTERKANAWARFRNKALELSGGLRFCHGRHAQGLESVAEMLDWSLPPKAPENCTADQIEAVTTAMERGEAATHPIPIILGTESTGSKCGFCGQEALYQFDGLTFTGSRCPVPDGPFILRFTTTGTLIFKDNLRDYAFPAASSEEAAARRELTGDGRSFCTHANQAVARLHERRGLMAIFVGNTCPSVYRLPQAEERDRFQIATEGHGRDGLGLSTDETFPPHGDWLFQVVTDIWLCCFMDLEAYLATGGTVEQGMRLLKVQPGSYEVRVACYERSFQEDAIGKPTIYATLEQVT